VLELRVQPGARRTAITAVGAAAVRIAVTARPERGKANEAALAVLAEALGVPHGRLELIQGAHARTKRVRVHGMAATELADRLGALGAR
jgi:uncharacterized protein YggU (UPF0235/DUF167 family)